MKSRIVLLTIALVVLAIPGMSLGQHHETPKPENARFGDPTSTARAYQDYLYGVIKNLNKNELVLDKTKFGIDQSVKLDAKTKYLRDGKPSSWDRLAVGDQVWVDVKANRKTGEMTAKKVLTGVVAPTIRK
jgi:hypothetical protein